MTKDDYKEKIINEAVGILENDGIILVPTDTIYGFAIDSRSKIALEKIYEIKKRDLNKKLPFVVDTYDRLMELCDVDMDKIKRFNSVFPGKLTLVLKRKDQDCTVAVRMINNERINRIISRLDAPLMLTSANISGKEVSENIIDIIDEFEDKIDMVIVGDRVSSISSTIVEVCDDELILIREGAIPFEKIKELFFGRHG